MKRGIAGFLSIVLRYGFTLAIFPSGIKLPRRGSRASAQPYRLAQCRGIAEDCPNRKRQLPQLPTIEVLYRNVGIVHILK